MAEIVAGFILPHDPLMVARPNAVPAETSDEAWRCFDVIIERLKALKVDTIITIGDDHYTVFGPHCIPQCLIAIGDVSGPVEAWLGVERADMPNDEPLAVHIMRHGHAGDVDWAFAKSIVVDHSMAVPYHLCYRHVPDVKVVPVYLNAGVEPFIPNAVAARIGRSIAAAVATMPASTRVAIIGTGGCSHWVGMGQTGSVNEVFDNELMSLVEAGDLPAIIAMSDDYVLEQAGNGALELKNWICAMAAVGAVGAERIGYRAAPGWIAGIGFAELKLPEPAVPEPAMEITA